MLIAMAGLPGSGKSTLAGEIARALGCSLLSVDPIEAAMWRAGVARDQLTGLAAYVIAEDLARAQMLLGHDVVIDAVNDADAARGQWEALAAELGEPLAFVEVFCSDETEHRRRLTERRRDIVGFPEPTWDSVVARRAAFAEWTGARLRLDSMFSQAENVAAVLAHVASRKMRDSSSGSVR
ncbi:AAA family ATPase [Microbacterium marinum]|uniref:AAA family ATPase n=1 Tax=Microbacterium marinum TaxID=421115 RepID=UPI003851425C